VSEPAPRRRRLLVWVAFALVHAWLVVLGVVVVPAEAFWDLDLYRWWAGSFLGFDEPRPVLDLDWVYPPGALVPMVLPGLVTVVSTPGYALAWSALVTVMHAVVVALLLRRGAVTAALWWIAFLLALGPVSVGRLDAAAVPLAVLGLLAADDGARAPAGPATSRTRLAATLLTAGAWVKVVSGPLLMPVATAARRPWRDVVAPAAAGSALVVATVLLLGGTPFGFLTTQSDRGLQAESVAGTPWVLGAALDGRTAIAYDQGLFTHEVVAAGAATAAGVLDVLLPVGLAVAAGLLLLARRHGTAVAVLLPASLVLTLWLIVTNKVGSPQFLAWLAAPVVALLAVAPRRPELRRWVGATAVGALVAAALTQVVFPWGHPALVAGDPVVSSALAVRNVLLLVLLVLGVAACLSAARRVDRVRTADPVA
jgi:hypothetical protein